MKTPYVFMLKREFGTYFITAKYNKTIRALFVSITYPDATQINTVNLFIIVYDYDIFINVTISFSVKIDASFKLLGHVKSEFLFYLLEF